MPRYNWARFRQLWDSYEIATALREKPMAVRVATFITAIGSDALDIHNNLPYSNETEKKDLEKILELWEKYCAGRVNIIFERYVFNSLVQKDNWGFEEYLVKLKKQVKLCDYGAMAMILCVIDLSVV